MTLSRQITKSLIITVLLSVLVLLYIGLQGTVAFPWEESANATPLAQSAIAQATLSDPAGTSQLGGQVTASEASEGLVIEANISNAPPGYHGIHVHEMGSCADAGNAAGGHFNPDGVKHGKLSLDGFENAHAGDLGNILISSNGTGRMRQTLRGLAVLEGRYALTNHAVILHTNRDDFGQPTGNAGGRIGCGILTTETGQS